MSSTTSNCSGNTAKNSRHDAQEPKHNQPEAQERSEQPRKPSLVAEMSRVGHDVCQLFDDASSADRENIIRFLELLIRKLKRVADG